MLYMLDTNIISYLAEGHKKVIDNLEKLILSGNTIGISVVAFYEVERGLKYKNASNKLTSFYDFSSQCKIFDLSSKEVKVASDIYAELRKSGQTIEDADIFIGATALTNNAVLVTNNEEHLRRIKGLKIENWIK